MHILPRNPTKRKGKYIINTPKKMSIISLLSPIRNKEDHEANMSPISVDVELQSLTGKPRLGLEVMTINKYSSQKLDPKVMGV